MNLQRLIVCGLIFACCSYSEAALRHRYSFETDASDSVGGAHAVVVDAGEPTHQFVGGLLDVSANQGNGSDDGIPEDAYVDLPNHIVRNAFNEGVAGQLTIELWAQASENRNWAALFSAGAPSNGIEGSSAGGGNYIQIIPQAGNAPNTLRSVSRWDGPDPANNETITNYTPGGADAPLSTSETTHIVTVYDQSSGLPGTLTLYVNGSLAESTSIADGLDLSELNDINIWLGRSQWNDPVFDGYFDELRIYDHGLSGGEIAANFRLGPDNLVPEPTSISLLVLAMTMVLSARRRTSERCK